MQAQNLKVITTRGKGMAIIDFIKKYEQIKEKKPSINDASKTFIQTYEKKKAEEWINSVNSLLDNVKTDYEARNNTYQDPVKLKDYKETVSGEIEKLLSNTAADSFLSSLGDDYIIQSTETRKLLKDIQNNLNKEVDYWSQFENEDAYKNSAAYYNTFMDKEDFEEKSKEGNLLTQKEVADKIKSSSWSLASSGLLGTKAKEKAEIKISEEATRKAVDLSGADLTPEQTALYNYILATSGQQEAYKYLGTLHDELTLKTGEQIAGNLSGPGDYTKMAATAGISQFIKGAQQLFTPETVPVNRYEVASQYAREDLGKGAQVAYDLGVTTANMLPSILISAATGGVGGAIAGAGTLGASAGGNAYNQAKVEGYSDAQARWYGLLIGASEAGLQYALGGIGALGKGVTTKLGVKALQGINNVILRTASELGLKMASEGVEEYLQDILNPLFRNIALGENNQFKAFSEDALYSALLGALSGALFEGGDTVASNVSIQKTGTNIIKQGKTRNVIDAGLALKKVEGVSKEATAEAKKAYDMAVKIDEGKIKPNPESLGKLSAQIDSYLVNASKEKVQEEEPTGDIAKEENAEIAVTEPIEEIAEPLKYTVFDKDTSESIEITGTEDGYIQLQNGKDILIEEAEFEDDRTKELYIAAQNAQNPNLFIKNISDNDVSIYSKAFKSLEKSATAGLSFNDAYSGVYANAIDKQTAFKIYTDLLTEIETDSASLETQKIEISEDKVKKTIPEKKGVTKEYSATELSNSQKLQLGVLNTAGQYYNIEFVIVDSITDAQGRRSGANAKYDWGTNKIYIALNSLHEAYLYHASHELYHYLESENPLGAGVIKNKIIEELKNTEGYNYEERLAHFTQLYGGKYAESELVASSIFNVLDNKEAVNRLVSDNYTLWTKVQKWIDEFIANMKKLWEKLSNTYTEVKVLKDNEAYLKTISEYMDNALTLTRIKRTRTKSFNENKQENIEAENRYSATEVSEEHRKEAERIFGYTQYYSAAGYILPNGKMLNFAEDSHQPQQRTADHRDINIVFTDNESNLSNTKLMVQFMNEGNIRMAPEVPGIDLPPSKPTPEQLNTIYKFVQFCREEKYFSVTFSDIEGNVSGELNYEGNINPSKVKNDIIHYYETGVLPEVSEVQKFRYSLKDSTALYSKETMDSLYDNYSVNKTSSHQDYAQRYVTYINPDDFLKISTKSKEQLERIEKTASELYGNLDVDKLSKSAQVAGSPFLVVDFNQNAVIGHEGRHRMALLKDKGIDKVAITIIPSPFEEGKYNRQKINKVEVTQQDEGKYKITLQNIFPLSRRYESEVRQKFSDMPAVDKNVRFSLKDISDAGFYNLMETNQDFEQMQDALNEALNTVKPYKPTREEIDKIASNVISKYDTGYKASTLSNNLDHIFSILPQANKEALNELVSALSDVSKRMVEKSKTYNDEMYKLYADVREYLRGRRISLSKSQKAEVTYLYGSYNKFRQLMFGKIFLTDKGIPLDSIWNELSSKAYNYFPEDANEGDMPVLLLKFYDSIKPTMEYKDLGMEVDSLSTTIAYEIFGQYIKSYKENNIAAKYQEKIDWLIKQNEKEAHERQKKFIEWQREYRDQVQYSFERRQSMKNIERIARSMFKRLNEPTNYRNIPEVLKIPVVNVLKSIDFITKPVKYSEPTEGQIYWHNAFSQLNSILQRANDDDSNSLNFNEVITEDLTKEIGEIMAEFDQNKVISEMSVTQLKQLEAILAQVNNIIKTINTFYANRRSEKVSEIGNMTIDDLSTRKEKVSRNKIIEWIDKALNLDMLDSFSYFRQLGPGADTILDELYEGFNKRVSKISRSIEYYKKEIEPLIKKEWTDKKNTITFELGDGKINLSIAQIMSLHELAKREQALIHILASGIRSDIDKKKNDNVTPTLVTMEELTRITNSLTKEQKNVADKIQKFFETEVASWGNETSMQIYGIKKFTEKNYFPIVVNDNFTKTKSKDEKNTTNFYSILNQGITKRTVEGAKDSVILIDIFNIYTDHTTAMASYYGYSAPILDAMAWYNFRTPISDKGKGTSVKEAIEKAYGKRAQKYFETLISDINGEAKRDSTVIINEGLISNYKAASVGFNLRVAIQQPTAYFRAMSVIEPRYMLKALARKANVKESIEYSGIAKWKSYGFMENALGFSMKKVILGFDGDTKIDKALTEIKEAAMWLPQKADEVTWGVIWNAARAQIESTKKFKINSPEFYQAVAKLFDKAVNETQVVDSVFHRSQWMRSRQTINKISTAFMSEPTKTYNMIRNVITEVYRYKKPQFTRQMIRTMFSAAISLSVNAVLAKGFIDILRDDDEDKKWYEKWKDAAIANLKDDYNPLTYIPIIKDISSIAEGYDPSRFDLKGVQHFVYGLKQLEKLISSGEGDFSKPAINILKGISYLTGVPAYSLYRDVNSIVTTITGKHYGDMTMTEKYNRLYKYTIEGDKKNYDEYMKKLETEGKSISTITTGIAGILAETEEARKLAKLKEEGKSSEYKSEFYKLVNKGFDFDVVMKAINKNITEGKTDVKINDPDEDKSVYDYKMLIAEIESGDMKELKQVKEDLLSSGKTEAGMRSSITSYFKPILKEMYAKGNTKEVYRIREILVSEFGYSRVDIAQWLR